MEACLAPSSGPNGDASRVGTVIDRLLNDGSIISRADGTTHDVRTVAISEWEGEALTRWVTQEGANRTIEIGLGYGLSALYICQGLLKTRAPRARHVALDPFQERRFSNCGLQALDDAGVRSIVEHHEELSQIALPAFLKSGWAFDLAFVDGNHRFDFVFLDLFYLGRLLPKGGVILLDDYDLPGIQRAVSFFLNNLDWRIEETSRADDPHQWVVLRTAESEDSRDFRHFVPF